MSIEDDDVIKGYSLLAKRPDVSSEFFHEHWRTVHADHAQKITSLRRYIQAHRIDAEVPCFAQSPYDGIAEVWWDDLAAADLVANDPDYVNNARLDEPNFIDMQRLAHVLTEERPLERGPDVTPDEPEVALLLMLKRRPDVALEEFRGRWPAEAAVALTASAQARRIVTALTVSEAYGEAVVEPLYDGVAELSWAHRTTYEDDWRNRGHEVAAAVMAFCDAERTHAHLAYENQVI
jgi:uncharacterized protein (TIGR02118 family)